MPTISRAAEPDDEAAILSLARAFATSFIVEVPAFHQAFSAILTDTHLRLIVAEYDEVVIGYLLGSVHMTFYANGSVAWVEEITVDEAYRGQGIGRMLVYDFERWAAERDARLVALATRRAAAFYESLGYEESARYYRKLL